MTERVRAQYAHFRACYEQGLKRHAALEGQVVTVFVIGKQGKVNE